MNDKKQLFLSDCEILGLCIEVCVDCQLTRRPAFRDPDYPLRYLSSQHMEWIVYTQIPFHLHELRSIFALARKYTLVPEKQSTKVDELLAATKEALARFEHERLFEARPDFFAVRERGYLHDTVAQWHQWAEEEVRTAEGNRARCWTPIDMFIENKVS